MTIKNLIIAAFSVLFLASCGSSDTCECYDLILKIMKEADGDMVKVAEIQEKRYKAEGEACKKKAQEIESLPLEELKAKQKEIESCASFKELQKMTEEDMLGH